MAVLMNPHGAHGAFSTYPCRSPAEGAYSEGFLGSRLNQDYCIACPTTGSLFDFRTGEIKDWYPSNFVLRTLTPQSTCRNLRTYPVRLEQVGSFSRPHLPIPFHDRNESPSSLPC